MRNLLTCDCNNSVTSEMEGERKLRGYVENQYRLAYKGKISPASVDVGSE